MPDRAADLKRLFDLRNDYFAAMQELYDDGNAVAILFLAAEP